MTHVVVALNSGPAVVEPIYQADVWAVTPRKLARGFSKVRFVVTHKPSGCICQRGLEPLTSDGAINLCRALAAEFPGFYADANTATVTDDGHRPPMDPAERQAMGRRIVELYQQARASERAARRKARHR